MNFVWILLHVVLKVSQTIKTWIFVIECYVKGLIWQQTNYFRTVNKWNSCDETFGIQRCSFECIKYLNLQIFRSKISKRNVELWNHSIPVWLKHSTALYKSLNTNCMHICNHQEQNYFQALIAALQNHHTFHGQLACHKAMLMLLSAN